MRARLIRTKADPALTDQWIETTKGLLVAASKAREGYRGYFALYDRESGEAIAVTLWEDKRAEAASDEASAPSRQAFADAVGAELRVDRYDVAVVDVATASWISGLS